MRFGRNSLLCLALLLSGCGPGSGGSGVPSGSSSPDGTSPPPVATPTPTPSPTPPAPGPAAGCAAPSGADSQAWQGQIQALNGVCLTVADRSIQIDEAELLRRSGAAATLDDLRPGQWVTIEPLANDPGRAARVIIEDLPAGLGGRRY